MHASSFFLVIVFLAFHALAGTVDTFGHTKRDLPEDLKHGDVVPGKYIVQYHEDAGVSARNHEDLLSSLSKRGADAVAGLTFDRPEFHATVVHFLDTRDHEEHLDHVRSLSHVKAVHKVHVIQRAPLHGPKTLVDADTLAPRDADDLDDLDDEDELDDEDDEDDDLDDPDEEYDSGMFERDLPTERGLRNLFRPNPVAAQEKAMEKAEKARGAALTEAAKNRTRNDANAGRVVVKAKKALDSAQAKLAKLQPGYEKAEKAVSAAENMEAGSKREKKLEKARKAFAKVEAKYNPAASNVQIAQADYDNAEAFQREALIAAENWEREAIQAADAKYLAQVSELTGWSVEKLEKFQEGANEKAKPSDKTKKLQREVLSYPLTKTGVSRLHRKFRFGQHVRISFVDSGVDYTHPALGGDFGPGKKISFGYDIIGRERSENPLASTAEFKPMDCSGHGTAAVGVVAANNSYTGLTGVAYLADIGMYRVEDCQGRTDITLIAKGVEESINAGAHIISIGGYPDLALGDFDPLSKMIDSAIAQNNTHVVTSAGIRGSGSMFSTPNYQSVSSVISVADVTLQKTPVLSQAITWKSHGTTPKSWSGFIYPSTNYDLRLEATDAAEGAEATEAEVTFATKQVAADKEATVRFARPWVPSQACAPGTFPMLLDDEVLYLDYDPCVFTDAFLGQLAENNVKTVFFGGTKTPEAHPLVQRPGLDLQWAYLEPEMASVWKGFHKLDKIVTVVLQRKKDREVAVKFAETEAPFVDVAPDSSWGPTVDGAFRPMIAAPGARVFTTIMSEHGSYEVVDGLLGAPFVAGSMALIIDYLALRRQGYRNNYMSFTAGRTTSLEKSENYGSSAKIGAQQVRDFEIFESKKGGPTPKEMSDLLIATAEPLRRGTFLKSLVPATDTPLISAVQQGSGLISLENVRHAMAGDRPDTYGQAWCQTPTPVFHVTQVGQTDPQELRLCNAGRWGTTYTVSTEVGEAFYWLNQDGDLAIGPKERVAQPPELDLPLHQKTGYLSPRDCKSIKVSVKQKAAADRVAVYGGMITVRSFHDTTVQQPNPISTVRIPYYGVVGDVAQTRILNRNSTYVWTYSDEATVQQDMARPIATASEFLLPAAGETRTDTHTFPAFRFLAFLPLDKVEVRVVPSAPLPVPESEASAGVLIDVDVFARDAVYTFPVLTGVQPGPFKLETASKFYWSGETTAGTPAPEGMYKFVVRGTAGTAGTAVFRGQDTQVESEPFSIKYSS